MSAQIGAGTPSPDLYGLIVLNNALLAGLFFISIFPVAIWVYRVNANLREAGLTELRYSPGWAVGSFFVPLANLVVPFMAMRRLHNRSFGEDPINADIPVADVTSWWSCHITAALVLTFTTGTFLFNFIPGIWLTTPPAADTGLNIMGFALLAGSGWFLTRIIGAITAAQAQGLGAAAVFE